MLRVGTILADRYLIKGVIGRGGMGTVYLADRDLLGSTEPVAIKTISPDRLFDSRVQRRFRKELQAAFGLNHPNIVRVFDADRIETDSGDLLFYVMERVEGCSLAERMLEGQLGFEAGARILLAVTQAVAYIHEQGIIHRDLKPANILLDQEGNPRVTDFGLARIIGHRDKTTIGDGAMGTPHYMAPETLDVSEDRVAEWTDIYSLGAILFEMLTGRPPFEGEPHQILHLLQNTEPADPVTLVPGVPRDLATICLKCLEKEPERRYNSASSLASDLERFLQFRPILARPTTRIDRLRKWVRRSPIVASLSLAVLIASLIIGVVGTVAYLNRREVGIRNAQISLEFGRQKFLEGKPREALPFLAEASRRIDSPALRFLLSRTVSGFGSRLLSIGGKDDPLVNPVFSADGCMILSIGPGNAATLWDSETGEKLHTLGGHEDQVRKGRFSPAGSLAATWTSKEVCVWNTSDGTRRTTLHPDSLLVVSASLSPDEQQILTAGGDDCARLWNLEGTMVAEFKGHRATVLDAVFSPDGRLIATTSKDRTVRLWSIDGEEVGRSLEEIGWTSESIVFSPNSEMLAGTSMIGKRATLWEVDSGRVLSSLETGNSWRTSTLFVNDGTRCLLADGTDSGTGAVIWDLVSGKRLSQGGDHLPYMSSVSISEEGRRFVTSGFDNKVHLWSLAGGEFIGGLPEVEGPVAPKGVFLSPDGGRVMTLDPNGTGTFWDLNGSFFLGSLSPTSGSVDGFVTAPEGTSLLITGSDGIGVWSLETFSQVSRINGPEGRFRCAVYSDDGTRVLVGTDDQVALWDISKGMLLSLVELEDMEPVAVEFSPDGRRILCVFKSTNLSRPEQKLVCYDQNLGAELEESQVDGRILGVTFLDERWIAMSVDSGGGSELIVRIEQDQPTTLSTPHESGIAGVVFNRNRTAMATWGPAGDMLLWSLPDLVAGQPFEAHSSQMSCATFSNNGDYLATADANGLVRFWDAATGTMLMESSDFGGRVSQIGFSGDDSKLVTLGVGNRVAAWNLEVDNLDIAALERIIETRDSSQGM